MYGGAASPRGLNLSSAVRFDKTTSGIPGSIAGDQGFGFAMAAGNFNGDPIRSKNASQCSAIVWYKTVSSGRPRA
jgi:hypothetical protein